MGATLRTISIGILYLSLSAAAVTETPVSTPTETPTPLPSHWTYHAYRQGVDGYTGSFFIHLIPDRPDFHMSKSDYGWVHAPFYGLNQQSNNSLSPINYGPTLIGFQNIQVSSFMPHTRRAILTLAFETVVRNPLPKANRYAIKLIRRAVYFDRSTKSALQGTNLTTYEYASFPHFLWGYPGARSTLDYSQGYVNHDEMNTGESLVFLHFDVTEHVRAWIRGQGGPELVFLLERSTSSIEDISQDVYLFTEENPEPEFRPQLEIWQDYSIPTPSPTFTLPPTPTLVPTSTPTPLNTPQIISAILCGPGGNYSPIQACLRSPDGVLLKLISIHSYHLRWAMTAKANSGGIADNFIFGFGPAIHQNRWDFNLAEVVCYYASPSVKDFYYEGQRNAPFPWLSETGWQVPRIETGAAVPSMPPGRPYDVNPSDEVRIAAGNLLGDSRDEVLVTQGCFAQSRFRIVEFTRWGSSIYGLNTTYRPLELGNPPGGINLGTADVDGDGYDEIIAAQVGEPYNEYSFHFGSTIQAINITNPSEIDTATITGSNIQRARIFPVFGEFTNPSSALRVAGGDIDGDGKDEVIVTTACLDLRDAYGPIKVIPGGNRIIILRPDFTNDNFPNGWFTVARDGSGNPISFQLFTETENPTGDIRISIGNLDDTPAEEIVIGFGWQTKGDVFVYRFDDTKNGRETLVELNHFLNKTFGVFPVVVRAAN